MYRWICIRREVEETLSGVYGEYPFAVGDVQSSMILEEWMKMVTNKPQ
jgi:hypothetical protein